MSSKSERKTENLVRDKLRGFGYYEPENGPCCTRNLEDLSMMSALDSKRDADFLLKTARIPAVQNAAQFFYSLVRHLKEEL